MLASVSSIQISGSQMKHVHCLVGALAVCLSDCSYVSFHQAAVLFLFLAHSLAVLNNNVRRSSDIFTPLCFNLNPFSLKFLIPSCSSCFSGLAWWARPARVSHASSSEILVSHICRLLVSALLFTSTLNISFHFKAWRSSAIVYLLYQLKNGFYCITDERPVIKSVILMCMET